MALLAKKEKFAKPPCDCQQKIAKCLAAGNGENWCKRQGLYCDQDCMWSNKFYSQ